LPLIVTEEPAKRRSRRLNPDGIIPILSKEPNSKRIPLHQPNIITHAAIDAVTANVYYGNDSDIWTPNKYITSNPAGAGTNHNCNIEHLCAPVVHPTTGETITSYNKLAKDEEMRETWTAGFGKDFGNLAQGDNKNGTPGMNCVHVMDLEQIKNIPADRVVTYARVVVDFRPQKADPNRVRITAGGNLIAYPDEVTTRTADLTCSKILWNSVLSTENAKYAVLDIANFYLGTPLDRHEYMKMPLKSSPHTSKSSTILMKRRTTGMYGLKFVERFTDYRKLESFRTNSSEKY
jgi:hypothetical protein